MTDPFARLAAILEQENAALAALDFPRAIALLPEKQEAVRLFSDPPPNSVPDHLRDLADTNRRLLERAMAVQGRVIELVVAALPQQAAAGRYTPAGSAQRGGASVAFALLARA